MKFAFNFSRFCSRPDINDQKFLIFSTFSLANEIDVNRRKLSVYVCMCRWRSLVPLNIRCKAKFS